MKTIISLSGWVLLAGAVLHIGFAPDNGVATTGSWAATGLTLLGLAMCRRSHEQQTAGQ